MERRKFTHQEIEKLLNSMDGSRRAEPSPFFYTRLHANLGRREEVFAGRWNQVKPALVVVSLALLIVLNITAIRSCLNTSRETVNVPASGIETVAQAYDLGESAVYNPKISGR